MRSWRVFKKGFFWGKFDESVCSTSLTDFLILGGTMATLLSAQITLFTHMMQPGMRPMRDLVAVPIVFGLAVGCGVGAFEVVNNPQVIHKPAI